MGVEFILIASIVVLVVAGVLMVVMPKWRAAIVAFVIASPIPPIP